MKNKLNAKSAAIAAFIGLVQVAHADPNTHSFTPLENLPPEVRQQIVEKLNELTKNIKIDWEHIVVGINENGELTLKSKDEACLPLLSAPSSFSSKE